MYPKTVPQSRDAGWVQRREITRHRWNRNNRSSSHLSLSGCPVHLGNPRVKPMGEMVAMTHGFNCFRYFSTCVLEGFILNIISHATHQSTRVPLLNCFSFHLFSLPISKHFNTLWNSIYVKDASNLVQMRWKIDVAIWHHFWNSWGMSNEVFEQR